MPCIRQFLFPKGKKVVGDLGIEPSVRLREGVTVPCHTLRPVAHFLEARWPRCEGVFIGMRMGRQPQNTLQSPLLFRIGKPSIF